MRRSLSAAMVVLWAAWTVHGRPDDAVSHHEPARRGPGDRVATPVNQIVEPGGRQLDLPGLRPQALALSPDGHILATSGNTHDLLIIDPATWKILAAVPLPPNSVDARDAGQASAHNLVHDDKSELSFTGLVFSPDVDSTRYIASDGSVTVIDGHSGKVSAKILVGKHASALAVAPGAKRARWN